MNPKEAPGLTEVKPRFRIRDAIPEKDAGRIVRIYTPYVTGTATSFEYEVPTEEEMKGRMVAVQEAFPWLIYESLESEGEEGERWTICGYAYGCKHRVRPGYQWVTEVGIYLAPEFQGQGIGGVLYKKLCSLLRVQGYFKALAIIVQGTGGSTNFHKRLGFQFVMEWKNYGVKFGQWRDVAWYQLELQPEYIANPPLPQPYPAIRAQISLEI